MRILSIEQTPFHILPYLAAAPSSSVETHVLPVLRGFVDHLPEGLDAILCASDLQGRTTPRDGRETGLLLGEALASELHRLAERGQIPDPGAIGVVLAGDLYTRKALDRRGGQGDVRAVWRAFAHRFRWVAGVAGNHDVFGLSDMDLDEFRRQPRIYLLDGEVRKLDGLTMGGVSGIIGNSRRRFRRSVESFVRALRDIIADQPEILVLHEGPDVPMLGLPGNPMVRETLSGYPEVLVVCGHNHWRTPLVATANGGQVVNVDSRAVLLIRK